MSESGGPRDGSESQPRRKLTFGGTRAEGTAWPTPAQLGVLVTVVIGAYAAFVMVRALRGLLIMLLLALFLSFGMEPAVQFLARRGWKRGLATGAVFISVFVVSAGIVWVMTGFVIGQANQLAATTITIEDVNRLVERLPISIDFQDEQWWDEFWQEFGERLQGIAVDVAGSLVGIGATAIGLVARTLAVALITFYLVADGPRLRRTLAAPLPPARQREMLAIWELAVAKTGGYLYSRLLIGAVSAAAHTVALFVLGVPQALALGLIMGLLTAFIPLLGVPIGSILLLVAALIYQPITALWLLIFIAVYQQFENYFFAPKIQAHTMDLHPAVAFVSVLVGVTLMGAVGALLALPATAIVKALLSTYVHRHELIEELEDIPLLPPLDDDGERETGTERAPEETPA